jgi:hypothetical protein
VELLLAGVPLERVSILLGLQSVKVTERHYTPWVRARQEQLEADVRRTWNTDTQAAIETKSTREVHATDQRPNSLNLNTNYLVEAAGVEPASENVTGQKPTCIVAFMSLVLPKDVRGRRSERTRNASR